MTFEELQKFIDEQDEFFKTLKKYDESHEVWLRTIKLGEEYGELCDEILAATGHQRTDKLAASHELEGEFADMVIVTFLLAKSMDIDMQKALREKMEKIRTKHNKQLENH